MISHPDLATLAEQLRKQIIETCSKNGGHIGASLGAVDLTIALHAEFNSPVDAFVWDVGHQSYAHKLLTGREKTFNRLRKSDGPCGFTSRQEGPHDPFGAGHSSTSISAALGIAEGKRIREDASWTIAIIGDGGLTAGLAFEALNQAGAAAEPRLLIVLNDNNLSISPNVGALEPRKFFEALGFAYIGPIDGHDIAAMRSELNQIKKGATKKVCVLHVRTKKGKGFAPAEKDPVRFHGVGPFDKITGEAGSAKGKSYSEVFAETATELASSDKTIVAITAAMADGTGLSGFAEKHPDRFYDVGIAEPHALVFAAGLASQKLKPIAAIYSTFLQRAVDSIIHDIALQNLDVVIGVDRAGLVGADGPTHHGLFDIPILRSVPNVSIAAPSCASDMQFMVRSAITQKGLKAIRYPRGSAPVDPKFTSDLGWGKARKLKSGTAVVIWALGSAVQWAHDAIATLDAKDASQVTLVDARFVKPLDLDMLRETLNGARALMTVEDGSAAGGFGSAIVEALLEHRMNRPSDIRIKGVSDRFVAHGEISEQREWTGLSSQALAKEISEMITK